MYGKRMSQQFSYERQSIHQYRANRLVLAILVSTIKKNTYASICSLHSLNSLTCDAYKRKNNFFTCERIHKTFEVLLFFAVKQGFLCGFFSSPSHYGTVFFITLQSNLFAAYGFSVATAFDCTHISIKL